VALAEPRRVRARVQCPDRGGAGAETIEAFRRLGALDTLGLLVLPIFLGDGMRLTPTVATDTTLTLTEARPLPEGAVDLVYACA
jgi:hypothetical protein